MSPESCNYDRFLNNYPPEQELAKRSELWSIFDGACKEVKSFSNSWCEITEVLCDLEKNHLEWGKEAKIRAIPLREDNAGAILHEIFHSAYDGSPIYNLSERNKFWGDGFCDAFRYLKEKQLKRESIIYSKIDVFKGNEAEIIRAIKAKDINSIQYHIPAALIVQRCKNYEGFKMLWKDLNSAPVDLDSYFGFSVYHEFYALR